FPGGIVLPDGVSLRGAGYDRTVIDVGTQPAGITIKGTQGNHVSDLTIRTQGSSGLVAEGARGVEVRRVRILGGALGVQWRDVSAGRLENAVIANALVGVSLNRVKQVTVVNCTIAGSSALGVGLVDAEESAVFNNLVVDAGTGILVSGSRRGLAV